MMHLVVIGAHCLDAEVMAGGVIAKVTSRGHKATIIHVTKGERGHPFKRPEEFGEQLNYEMKKAAQALGADVIWMGFPAGNLPISDSISAKLFDILVYLSPTHIITHWKGSWHPRHVSTHYNVIDAIKRALKHGKINLSGLYFGENCEDLMGFSPTLYIDISEVKELWLRALESYELFRLSRELKDIIPYVGYYLTMAKIRGYEAGVPYAQAFMESKKIYDLGKEQYFIIV